MTTTTTTTKTPALFTFERQAAYMTAAACLFDVDSDSQDLSILRGLLDPAHIRECLEGGFLPTYSHETTQAVEAYLAEHGEDAPWVLAVMDGGKIWYAMEGNTINW